MAGVPDTIEVGETAPDFQRPGVDRGEFAMYDLHRAIDHGDAVLLVFYPTDFLQLPTDAFQAMHRAGWTTRTGLTVWGISGDSIFAHHAYADEYGIDLPLLSDFHAGVASHYGLDIDDWEGHGRTPSWAWVFVDDGWTVRRVWSDPPTPRWTVPPVADFIDTAREHTGIVLDPLDLEAP